MDAVNKHKRKILRSQTRKLFKEIESIIADPSTEDNHLEEILAKLNLKENELHNIDLEIQKLIKIDEIENEILKCDEYNTNIVIFKTRINSKKRKLKDLRELDLLRIRDLVESRRRHDIKEENSDIFNATIEKNREEREVEKSKEFKGKGKESESEYEVKEIDLMKKDLEHDKTDALTEKGESQLKPVVRNVNQTLVEDTTENCPQVEEEIIRKTEKLEILKEIDGGEQEIEATAKETELDSIKEERTETYGNVIDESKDMKSDVSLEQSQVIKDARDGEEEISKQNNTSEIKEKCEELGSEGNEISRTDEEPEYREFGIGKKNLISKYDEKIKIEKKKPFKKDSDITSSFTRRGQKLEPIRMKLKQQIKLSPEIPELKPTNEYYTPQDLVRFKKFAPMDEVKYFGSRKKRKK